MDERKTVYEDFRRGDRIQDDRGREGVVTGLGGAPYVRVLFDDDYVTVGPNCHRLTFLSRPVYITPELVDEIEQAIRSEAHTDDQVSEVFRILGVVSK